MLNYIRADLYRIRLSIPRAIVLILTLLCVIAGLIWQENSVVWNSVNFVATTSTILMIVALILGFFEIVFVYTKDFKAKTMQTAIGRGLSRSQVVLTKFLECDLLILADLIFIFVACLIFSAVTGITLLSEQINTLFLCVAGQWLSTAICIHITSIFLFYLQNAGAFSILYLLVILDPPAVILSLTRNIPLLASLHLESITYTNVVNTFISQLTLRHCNIPMLFGTIFYLVLSYFIACILFKKRELEF